MLRLKQAANCLLLQQALLLLLLLKGERAASMRHSAAGAWDCAVSAKPAGKESKVKVLKNKGS
jgi:hypothetical protein